MLTLYPPHAIIYLLITLKKIAMNILKLYTMLRVQGASEMLESWSMSLSLEQNVFLSNHVFSIQNKTNNA